MGPKKNQSRATHELTQYPMRRKEVIGLHLLPIETKRRQSNQMPIYLADDDELVMHVRRVIIWLDLVDRCRLHGNSQAGMGRFVEHLAIFISEDGVAHGLGGECELHNVNESKRPTWPWPD